jgi:hypothetical protein
MPYHEQFKNFKLKGVESGKLIHVHNNIKHGAHVHLWEEANSLNEYWNIETLKEIDNNKYIVNIINQDMYLNLKGGVGKQGTQFHMWGSIFNPEDKNDISSQFLIEYINNDTVIIKTMVCDLYINADAHSSYRNGGIVHLWGNRDDSFSWGNNKWKLLGTDNIENPKKEIYDLRISKGQSKEEWDLCEKKFVSHEETSTNVDVEIGKIAQLVSKAVQAYFGDIFSLSQIMDNVTLSFSTSSTKHETDEKIIMHKDMNYLLIKLQTKTGSNKIKTGLFKKDKISKIYIAEICCLRPVNEAAEIKCKRLMNHKINEILDDVVETF